MSSQTLKALPNDIRIIMGLKNTRVMILRLQQVGQQRSVAILQRMEAVDPSFATFLVGAIKGALAIGPKTLHEHLHRFDIKYSLEEASDLYRFLERLIESLESAAE